MDFNKQSLTNILKLFAEQMGVDDVLEVCKSFQDDQEFEPVDWSKIDVSPIGGEI